MTSQPDKLFRDKLENFQRPAPVAAWERIEGGLNKNQSRGILLKFAAGISLFAVATFLLWPSGQVENQQATNAEVPVSPSENIEQVPTKKTSPAIAEQKIKNEISKKKSVLQAEPVVIPATTNEIVIETIPVIEPSPVQVAVIETNPAEEATSKKIVYTAEEVNAKFLKKKSPTEATIDEKKTSGIQKLMGLAYTIKNPDNGLGDLRQKKDEILALNFLSNEDKTNKEKN